MHVESYAVEVQNLNGGDWIEDSRFIPDYKWQLRRCRGLLSLFGLLRKVQPETDGDRHVLDLTAKADAVQRARAAIREYKPRSVRILRIWREGARIRKFSIWINGTWLE